MRGLVRMTANCSLEHMNWAFSLPNATCSYTKWYCTATCFVLEWCFGFLFRKLATTLSHQIMDGCSTFISNSCKTASIQLMFEAASTKLLYSTSVEDLAIVGYLKELHEVRLPPQNTKCPPWLRLFCTSSPQSASENTTSLADVIFLVHRLDARLEHR